MQMLETKRLILRQLTEDDAAFILQLLNEPSWIQYIGDRGVRTLDDAQRYIKNGPVAMYARHGFGMFLVTLKEDETPVGLCGLIKRDTLDDVDIGYAFLPDYWGKGYAVESAEATMQFAEQVHKLKRVVAITLRENKSSVTLLKRLGFHFERTIHLGDDPDELDL